MPLPYTLMVSGLGSRVEEYLLPILEAEGYRASHCVGRTALLETLNHSLDMVLLDLPTEDELAQFGEVRAACPCPILLIGPARNDRLLIAALEQGADDYVQRPFRTAELLARIRAQLRRRGDGSALTFGPLSLDPHGRQACRDGAPLDLSAEEYTLLSLLAARPGNIYPTEFIAGQLWGQGRRGEGERLDTVVARLRELIEPDPINPSVLGGDVASGFWLGGASRERHFNGGQ